MKSIQTKIVTLLLCSIVLTSLVIGIMSTVEISRTLHKKAEDNMTLLCEGNIEKLDSTLRLVEESVITLSRYAADALTDPSGLTDEAVRSSYVASVEQIGINHLMSTPGALSTYLYINPALTGEEAGFFWISKGAEATLSTLPLSDIAALSAENATVPLWWNDGAVLKEAMWLDSYLAPALSEYIISYIVPIHKDGVFLGIVGTDMPCSFLATTAGRIRAYETGFASILDTEGHVVYHPNYALGETIRTDKEGETDISERMDAHEGAPLLSYSIRGENRKMAFGTLRNGMRLCIIAPDREIYKGQNTLLTHIVWIIGLSVLVTTFMGILFARRLTKPIKKLHAVALEMQAGNLDVDLVPTTRDEVGTLTESFMAARDQLRQKMDTLYMEAHHDGLTGLRNQAAFSRLEAELDAQIANGDAFFAIAVLDVNRLKVTNDILGHHTGDVLLRTIAAHLSLTFGADNVYRFGGDEFAVFFGGAQYANYAEALSHGMREMKNLSLEGYPDVPLSCAVGAAAFDPYLDKSFADVRTRADRNMYQDKSRTKREAADWAEGAKGLRQLQIEKYLEFLEILSQSSEDYLFLFDMEKQVFHFLGNTPEPFALGEKSKPYDTLADVLALVHPQDRDMLSESLALIISGQKTEYNLNARLIGRTGSSVWASCRGRVIADESGVPLAMLGRVSTSALRPFYNPLTGLFNKAKLLQDFEKGVHAADSSCMMLLDIDHLAAINLQHGRNYGDELLRLVAQVLESRFPLSQVYHIEEDQFALFLHAASRAEATEIYEDIAAALAGKCTVSAAVVPNDPAFYLAGDTIYEYAGKLLKDKTEIGTLSFFTKEDLASRLSSVELFEEIEKSVHNNFEGFSVYYQPQVSAADYHVLSAEALLRFTSPTKGRVFPDTFIPILERTGLIHEVGMFVLETALRKAMEWRRSEPDFRISVNFSAVQLSKPDIAEKVLALLNALEVPGSMLTIEITESAQLESSARYAAIFESFRAAGIRIAIDDFGTGYSNLHYLKMLHADEIKIDRIFIKDIEPATYNYRVVSNIIDFAKANGFAVCLEGVENAEELAVLESLKPDILQGYLFGKPADEDSFAHTYIETDSAAYKEQTDFVRDLHSQREKMHIVRLNAKDILSQIDIGLWVIRVYESEKKNELFADTTMRAISGMAPGMSPSECYAFWQSHIKPGYEEVVRAMVSGMATSDAVQQSEYIWVHPTRGEITVRCTGKCVSSGDGVTVFEGFHRIISDMGHSYSL